MGNEVMGGSGLNKKWLGIGVTLVLLVGAVWLIAGLGTEEQAFHLVKRGPFATVVEANGELQSSRSVTISCPKIPHMWDFSVSFLVPEGSEVKEGQPLIGFDAKKLNDRLALRQSALASNKKELEKIKLVEQEALERDVLALSEAEVDVAKFRRKLQTPPELVAHLELRKHRFDLELAEGRFELAQSRLNNQREKMVSRVSGKESQVNMISREVETLKKHIEMMTVKAPKSGMVVYRKWGDGKLARGDTVWLGRPLLDLPDLTKMEVAAVIAERDAGRVAVGQKVNVRLDANPDKTFEGTVESLGTIFRHKSRDKPSIVFDAIVRVETPDPDLIKPGMAARLEILVEQDEDVLQIPEHLIGYDEGGAHVKLYGALGKTTRRAVTMGRRSAGVVEISEGLQENDRILVISREGESL